MSLPLYFSLGGLNVAIIDVIVLIALLIAIIVGVTKGFAKQVLGFLGFFAAVIVAYLICEPVAEFVKTTFPKVTETVSGWISSISGFGDLALLTPENAEELLGQSDVPVFLHGLIINLVQTNNGFDIIPMITNLAITAMTFVLLVIVLLILFAIFKKLFLWIANLKFMKPLDKTLGAVFGALVCVIIIVIVLTILVVFAQEFSVRLLAPALTDGTNFESFTSKILGAILELPFISNLLSLGI